VVELAGVPRGIVEGLPRSARATGLEVVEANGFFLTVDPELGFELRAATLSAARDRAIKSGLAAEKIDDLLVNLRTAKDGGCEWVSTPFFFDLALRKPN
jgi:hypothetical protein